MSAAAADAAASEALLRCWVRETATPVPGPGAALRLELASSAVTLDVPVYHHSPVGWHRFGPARFAATGAHAGTAALAGLLAGEAAARSGAEAAAGAELAARALQSRERAEVHLRARTGEPAEPVAQSPFLEAEQALLLGHPFHPAPLSRPGASEAELRELSPELRGSFPLHWFAAHPSVAATGAAPGTPDPAAVGRALAAGVDVPTGWVAIPAHPWQARDVRHRRGVGDLLDAGLLRDLGPGGERWHPTSSVRTVFRADAPVMLKLSLGLRITNSRRENLRSELALGERAHRLLDALEPELRAAHPGFRVLRDPGWLAVDPAGSGTESGLEVVLRENPFGGGERVACLAGLLAARPGDRSRLAAILHAAAAAQGAAVPVLAARWVERFTDHVAAPVAWLHDACGIGLEAHAQNLLVALDADGFPCGGWYRDNQGYYVAASCADRAHAAVPGLEADGVRAVFDDALVSDRVAYYLGVNALLGLVGALGAEGLAAEEDLLAAVRRRLTARPGALVARLLDAPTLPCKANLLTCADGRDELDGPVETQSLYVEVPNPLAGR